MTQSTLDDYQTAGVECPTCSDSFKHEQGMKAHHAQAHGESLAKKTVPCEQCGSEITRLATNLSENNFCDKSCHGDWLSENKTGKEHYKWNRVEVACSNCGESFNKQDDQYNRSENDFCSVECYHEYSKTNSNPTHIVQAVRRSLSELTWTSVARRYRNKTTDECEMCGEESGDRKHDVHHIIPIACGGDSGGYNLMRLCRSCHNKAEDFVMQYDEFSIVLEE